MYHRFPEKQCKRLLHKLGIKNAKRIFFLAWFRDAEQLTASYLVSKTLADAFVGQDFQLHETFNHSAPGQTGQDSLYMPPKNGRNMNKYGNMERKRPPGAFSLIDKCDYRDWMCLLQQTNGRPCCSPDLLSAQGVSVGFKASFNLCGFKAVSDPGALPHDWEKSWICYRISQNHGIH